MKKYYFYLFVAIWLDVMTTIIGHTYLGIPEGNILGYSGILIANSFMFLFLAIMGDIKLNRTLQYLFYVLALFRFLVAMNNLYIITKLVI